MIFDSKPLSAIAALASCIFIQGCVGPVLIDDHPKPRMTSDFTDGETLTAVIGDTVYKDSDSEIAEAIVLTEGFNKYTGQGNFKLPPNTALLPKKSYPDSLMYYCTRGTAVYGFFNIEIGPACFRDTTGDGSFDEISHRSPKHGYRVVAPVRLQNPIPMTETVDVSVSRIGYEYVITLIRAEENSLIFNANLRSKETGCVLMDFNEKLSITELPKTAYILSGQTAVGLGVVLVAMNQNNAGEADRWGETDLHIELISWDGEELSYKLARKETHFSPNGERYFSHFSLSPKVERYFLRTNDCLLEALENEVK